MFVLPVAAGVMFIFFDPLMVFLITISLYASLWLVFSPFTALLLFTVLVAVRPQEGIGPLEAIHVERLFALLAILGWGLKAAADRRVRPVNRPIAMWLVAFVLVCFLSIFTSIWKLGSFNKWSELLKTVVLAFLIAQMVNTPRRLVIFLSVYAVGSAWMGAESLRLYFSQGYSYVRMGIMRATTESASRGDPNSLAASMVIASCFAVHLIGSNRNFLWRLCWFAVVAISAVVVVLTGSRAAMLGSLFLLFYLWATHKKKIVSGIIILLVIVGAWFAMPFQYQQRFLTTFNFNMNPSASESAMGRVSGFKVGLRILLDRPFLGVGIGNFGVAHGTMYSAAHHTSWLEAHNLFAQVIGETGLLGLITFAGFVAVSMKAALRLRASMAGAETEEERSILALSRAAFAASLLLLILGLFGHNMMRYNWYINAGLISAGLGIANSLKSLPQGKRTEAPQNPEEPEDLGPAEGALVT